MIGCITWYVAVNASAIHNAHTVQNKQYDIAIMDLTINIIVVGLYKFNV